MLMITNREIFNKLEKEDISFLREAMNCDAKADEVMEALKKFGNITSSNKIDALMSIYSLLLKGQFKIKFGIILNRMI